MPLSTETIDRLLGRHAALVQQRKNHEPTWQELADYLMPHASGISITRTPGEKRTLRLYDATGIDAADRLANRLVSVMTNPATNWQELAYEDAALNDDYEAATWLEEDRLAKLRHDYLRSNAYNAFHELDLQLVVFGTGCLYVEERLPAARGFDGYVFEVLPLGTYDIAENNTGEVDTVFRVRRLTARQAARDFCPDVLSDKVKERLREGGKRLDEATPYLHIVMPREDKAQLSGQRYRAGRDMPYASCYLDMDDKKLVRESGYEEFPFFVPRWAKTADMPSWGAPAWMNQGSSPWGFGRGHIALPFVKSLNAICEWGLKALPLHLHPPGWTDDDSVIGNFDMTPGAMNTVRRGATIQPYQIGGNPRVVEFNMEDLRAVIRRVFFNDQLTAIPQKADMTAFEVAQRIKEMEEVMGPTFSRLTTELFDPLTRRTFGIRLRADVAAQTVQIPLAVLYAAQTAQGARIKVNYNGPLARSQRAGEIESMDNLYRFALEFATGTGETSIFDTLDHDAMLRGRAEVLGVPKKYLRDQRAVAKLQAERQAAQRQAAELEQQQQASEVARNVTPLLQPPGGVNAA